MAKKQSFDRVFIVLIALLLGAGLFILGSASMGLSTRQFGQPYYYFLHQLLFGVVPGLFLMYIGAHVPYHQWKRFSLLLLLFSIVLMSLVLIPQIGFMHGGARRWLPLGSFSFQPSELLKFAFIVYLATWLEARSSEIRSFVSGLLPFLIMSGVGALFLILHPDIGTLGVLLLAVSILFAVSGGTWRQILMMVILGAIVLGVLAYLEPYRMKRFVTFIWPSFDPQGIGYQSRQALIAIGSGGFWGRGFALSRQKFSYLPEPMGDSIFAITAEELGFIGSMAIIILYILFYLRGVFIVRLAGDVFGKLLGTGILLLVMIQAFINIAAISGLAPLTGVPLSFISYGGSALAIMMGEIGVLLNISRAKR